MVFVPHAQRVAHDARAAEQGKQDAFFAGVGAMPIHAQAECEKQADGNPQHLVRLLLIAVERVGFCNRALVLSSFCIYFVIVAYAKISANLIDAITIKKPLSWLLSQELADYN